MTLATSRPVVSGGLALAVSALSLVATYAAGVADEAARRVAYAQATIVGIEEDEGAPPPRARGYDGPTVFWAEQHDLDEAERDLAEASPVLLRWRAIDLGTSLLALAAAIAMLRLSSRRLRAASSIPAPLRSTSVREQKLARALGVLASVPLLVVGALCTTVPLRDSGWGMAFVAHGPALVLASVAILYDGFALGTRFRQVLAGLA